MRVTHKRGKSVANYSLVPRGERLSSVSTVIKTFIKNYAGITLQFGNPFKFCFQGGGGEGGSGSFIFSGR